MQQQLVIFWKQQAKIKKKEKKKKERKKSEQDKVGIVSSYTFDNRPLIRDTFMLSFSLSILSL